MNHPLPNILLIMTDQQRGDCLGVDGHPCLQTPNMDALAADGVRFRNAYSTCPVCIPARRSLMSGMLPATHGMVGYADGQEWNPPATLPQMLRDAGYHTGLVGRNMHLYPHRKRYGFEEMVVAGDQYDSDYKAYLDQRLPEAGGYYGSGVKHNDWTARTWHMPEHLHQTHWTVNQALRFLERRDPSRPWFLTASFLAPHPPLLPLDFYFQRYLRAELPEPIIGEWAQKPQHAGGAPQVSTNQIELQGEVLLSCRAAYYAMINHVDDEMRRLLSGMDYDAKNTLVIFTSDHGEMLGDHYMFQKSLPYEGAARVPFLMRLPGSWENARRGAVSELPVCLEDIMPTLLDVAGIEIPDDIDGRSLLPELTGNETNDWRDGIHIEMGGIGGNSFHAITNGREKYIWYSQTGREQFFHLETDREERHDLISCLSAQQLIESWRKKLMRELANRPEGFVQNGRLIPGQPHLRFVERSSRSLPGEPS